MVALTQVRLERRKKISIADTRRGDVGTITGIIGLTVKEGKYSDPAVHSQGDCRVTQEHNRFVLPRFRKYLEEIRLEVKL